MNRLSLAACIVIVGLARIASAQDASLPSQEVLKNIARLTITTADAGPSKPGHLLELGADSVRLLVDGVPQTIPYRDIQRIDIPEDSVKDGFYKGMLLMGGLCALVCLPGVREGADVLPIIAANAIVGGLFGLAFDYINRSERTIYVNPKAVPAGARMTVSATYKF